MADGRTIEQILKDCGYGHRKNDKSHNTGKHDIFLLSTGESVGEMTALESIDFLNKQIS